jgi:hypothetical protein
LSGRRASGLLPNVAGTLLPSGTAGFRYSTRGDVIRWSVSVAKGYRPHGVVVVDRAGQIGQASVYSGPGVPLRAIATYPAAFARIRPPSRLCSK